MPKAKAERPDQLEDLGDDNGFILVNNWMCQSKAEALENVKAAREAKDHGVHAVPFDWARKAPTMVDALKLIAAGKKASGYTMNRAELMVLARATLDLLTYHE